MVVAGLTFTSIAASAAARCTVAARASSVRDSFPTAPEVPPVAVMVMRRFDCIGSMRTTA